MTNELGKDITRPTDVDIQACHEGSQRACRPVRVAMKVYRLAGSVGGPNACDTQLDALTTKDVIRAQCPGASKLEDDSHLPCARYE